MPTTHRPQQKPLARQSGFTLLEVLVSVVILVLGVLGTAAMTLTAIRNSQQSGTRSNAVALANEIVELMRAYPEQAADYTGVINTTGSVGTLNTACYGAGCALASLSQHDLYVWAKKVRDQSILPSGNAVICHDDLTSATSTPTAPHCSGSGPLVVKLWWLEKNGDGSIQTVTKPQLTVNVSPF